ncbi:unnamed protein product [Darwinula stevensoni]|uniref:GST C-terminal domain-containing protein n=1 Tax=Darwinula stevensoni TaxID=69355 RepID=A0A7R8XC13_9CRUS|nr:unnamed protein product [Darwinula stevensoni]CAG0887040.1 unnamed protein product [Darwinula stevensoni]
MYRAIMGYLVTKYGRDDSLYPKDAEKRAMVDRILYFDIETLYRSIQDYFKPKILGSGILEPSKGNALKQSLEYLDEFLSADRNGGGSYVAGSQLTIADFAVLASVSHLVALGWSISSYPNVSRWFEKLKKELPFYHPCVDEGVKMLLDWISCVEEKTKKSSS